MVLSTLFGQFPFLKRLFADSAYAGPVFRDALANALPSLVTEIVRRSDQARGFVVLPKRWIVERTIGWLGRCRRLAKDWENLNRNALAFLRLASIRLMLRRLCNPSGSLRTDTKGTSQGPYRAVGTCLPAFCPSRPPDWVPARNLALVGLLAEGRRQQRDG